VVRKRTWVAGWGSGWIVWRRGAVEVLYAAAAVRADAGVEAVGVGLTFFLPLLPPPPIVSLRP